MQDLSLDDRVMSYVVSVTVWSLSSREQEDHLHPSDSVGRPMSPRGHTFHLNVGEATVRLQDVALRLGLRIDDRTITNADCHLTGIYALDGQVPSGFADRSSGS